MENHESAARSRATPLLPDLRENPRWIAVTKAFARRSPRCVTCDGEICQASREKNSRFPIDRKKPTEVSPQALQSTERPRRNVALILHRPTEEAYETTSGIRHRCIRPDGRGRGGRGASRPRPALRL